MMHNFTLKRERDLAGWPCQARYPEQALMTLSKDAGVPLFICEGPADYWLECRDPEQPGSAPLIKPVSSANPLAAATISKVAGGFTVTVTTVGERLLIDEFVEDEASTQEVLERAMRSHEIVPQQLKIKHVGFGPFAI